MSLGTRFYTNIRSISKRAGGMRFDGNRYFFLYSTEYLLAMFLHVFMNNVTCVKRNNHHMYELLKKGRNGDDSSFFNAIRIDHTVMQTPSFIYRFEKA